MTVEATEATEATEAVQEDELYMASPENYVVVMMLCTVGAFSPLEHQVLSPLLSSCREYNVFRRQTTLPAGRADVACLALTDFRTLVPIQALSPHLLDARQKH